MSVLEQLLSVQEHDTALAQLRHRRDTLPERSALADLAERAAALESRRAEVTTARDDIVRDQRRLEDEVAAVEAKIAEVDGQLYSGAVSAPRELQALQDEIAALRRRVDDLETRLLELMTALEPLDDTLAALDADVAAQAEEQARLEDRLAEAEAEVDSAIAAQQAERDDAASTLGPDQLAEYETLRDRMGGIAIARLVGSSCGGCHLALSAVDLDRIRKLPPDQPGICEECGRMLVH